MSVARRNTFDLFDEEADLLSTSEAKAAQKKKRRKRKPSLEHSENQTSQVAAKGQPTGDDEKHEHTCSNADDGTSSAEALPRVETGSHLTSIASKAEFPAPESGLTSSSRPAVFTNGHANAEQGTNCLKAGNNYDEASSSIPSSPSKARKQQAPELDTAANTGTAPPNSTFGQYLWAELNPNTAAPPSAIRHGLTERQRVYNAIMVIPYQLERLLWYGLLVCLDSFLAVFTVLPVRFARAVAALVRPRKDGGLQGDQLFDLLCVFIFAATLSFLRLLPAGTIYFWLKDLTQEFLKLHVVHSAVEIFDKIACSFAVDALEALSGTCGLYLSSSGRRWHAVQLLADVLMALGLILFHSTVLICQFMTFSVAINSKRSNALIALLIASNFVEIKGTIFKRFDPSKLFILVGQDVTERFHLLLTMVFVAVEEMDNSGLHSPSPELLRRCAYIFGAEIVIDIIKHAVLTKLNDIRPAVYQRFMKDVCEKAKGGQSHTAHRVVAFEPYAPAALFLRIALALLVIKGEQLCLTFTPAHTVSLALTCLASWVALFAAKALLGFSLRGIAQHFLQRHPKA